MKKKWLIYIPEEGHWDIPGKHATQEEARQAYLKWTTRKRIPAGSYITEKE